MHALRNTFAAAWHMPNLPWPIDCQTSLCHMTALGWNARVHAVVQHCNLQPLLNTKVWSKASGLSSSGPHTEDRTSNVAHRCLTVLSRAWKTYSGSRHFLASWWHGLGALCRPRTS